MADREQTAIDLLCGELQTSWSYCDPSCISCKFYHEESDMGARVSICVHGFGSSKESCGCYMTQREYLEFVRSGVANLKAENAKLRELVRILHMAYFGATNENERMDEALICEFSDSILKDLEKSRAKYEADRHRFDAVMCALGIEV